MSSQILGHQRDLESRVVRIPCSALICYGFFRGVLVKHFSVLGTVRCPVGLSSRKWSPDVCGTEKELGVALRADRDHWMSLWISRDLAGEGVGIGRRRGESAGFVGFQTSPEEFRDRGGRIAHHICAMDTSVLPVVPYFIRKTIFWEENSHGYEWTTSILSLDWLLPPSSSIRLGNCYLTLYNKLRLVTGLMYRSSTISKDFSLFSNVADFYHTSLGSQELELIMNLHRKNKTPVLGDAIPVLGVKLTG